MNKPEVGKPFVFGCNGKELAKVLFYYGIITETETGEQKIVCPFHDDMNPSMVVDIERGRWFCYGCNKSGDAFNFVDEVQKKKGKSGIKNIVEFFKILNSERVERLKYNPKIKTKKESEELYNMAHDYYYGLSRVDWKSSDIPEVIETKKYMSKRGFTAKTLQKVGAKVTYNKSYQLIFPMMDNGNFRGWVCRTTVKEVEQRRKYLYNGGFLRRNTLVGNYAGCNYVFVVEGFMDRLKFVQFGVENVVAILGWKMSREQEKKLRDAKVQYIISALDNDVCGKKGTEYLKTIFPNKVIRWKYLKGIKDPGDMNKEVFDKMYNKTIQELERKY